MTEREKLIETIRAFHVEKRSYSNHTEPSDDEALADALLAAGFGDVSMWQKSDASKEQSSIDYYLETKELRHRAEVAERALRNALKSVSCDRCPYKDVVRNATDEVNDCFAEFLEQAARELEEEHGK